MEAGSQDSAERVARDHAAFRDANEAIQKTAAAWEMVGLLPVICECADTSCSTLVRLTARQYEEVRANPRQFITAPGHHVHDQDSGSIIAEHDLYTIVEKFGETGDIAAQLDERSAEP